MFFFSKPFFQAWSYSLWTFVRVSLLGLAAKAFSADLIDFLIPMFLLRRVTVCLARLIADLMIGI